MAVAALGLGAVWLGVHPREEHIGPIREVLNIQEAITPLNLSLLAIQQKRKR